MLLAELWCWERLKAGEERDDRGWDGWMASLTQRTWVWGNSGSCWWTGKSGVLQSMGSQRVRHNWVTEMNWTEFMESKNLKHRWTSPGGWAEELGFLLPASYSMASMQWSKHILEKMLHLHSFFFWKLGVPRALEAHRWFVPCGFLPVAQLVGKGASDLVEADWDPSAWDPGIKAWNCWPYSIRKVIYDI